MTLTSSNRSRRRAVALLASLLLGASLQVTPAQEVPKGDTVAIKVRLQDEEHWIQIRLNEASAPRHCANFKILAEGDFYAGMAFHRVIRDYLVQAGDPLTRDESNKRNWGTGGVGYDLAPEIGLPHKRGAVGMARLRTSNPKKRSSGSQFYIMLTDARELDADYTVFGEVVEGLEILGRMSRARVDTNDVPVTRIEIVETRIGEPGFLSAITDPIAKVPEKISAIPNPLGGLRNPFAKKGEDAADVPPEPEPEPEAGKEKGGGPFGGLRNPFARKAEGGADAPPKPAPEPAPEPPPKPIAKSAAKPAPELAPEREIEIDSATAAKEKEGGGFRGLFPRFGKPKPDEAGGDAAPSPEEADEPATKEEKPPGPIGRMIRKIW